MCPLADVHLLLSLSYFAIQNPPLLYWKPFKLSGRRLAFRCLPLRSAGEAPANLLGIAYNRFKYSDPLPSFAASIYCLQIQAFSGG